MFDLTQFIDNLSYNFLIPKYFTSKNDYYSPEEDEFWPSRLIFSFQIQNYGSESSLLRPKMLGPNIKE